MRSTMRRLVLAGLVGCLIVTWSAHDPWNGLRAQQRSPVTATRLYTGPDGQTHAEEIDVKLIPTNPHHDFSELGKATGVQFSHSTPGRQDDWHTTRPPRYMITLSGRGEIELGSGERIPLNPGKILLAQDSDGKGHRTRVIGSEEWLTVLVLLGDQ